MTCPCFHIYHLRLPPSNSFCTFPSNSHSDSRFYSRSRKYLKSPLTWLKILPTPTMERLPKDPKLWLLNQKRIPVPKYSRLKVREDLHLFKLFTFTFQMLFPMYPFHSFAHDQGCPTATRLAPRRLPAIPWLLHTSHWSTPQSVAPATGRKAALQEAGRAPVARRGTQCGRALSAHSADHGRACLGVCHAIASGIEHGATQAVPSDWQAAQGVLVRAAVAGVGQGKLKSDNYWETFAYLMTSITE